MSLRPGRTRVAVVFGGRSSEHAISCVSAGSVLRHLDRERFDVVARGHHPRRRLGARHGRPRAARDPRAGAAVGRPLGHRRRAARRPDPRRAGGAGAGARRGGARRRRRRVPGAARSVRGGRHDPGAAGDGRRALRRGRACSRAPPAWTRSSRRSCWPRTACRSATSSCCATTSPTLTAAQRERLGLPVFVKPARAGSSVGITRVTDWAALDDAIAAARAHDPKVLVEAAITGREVECGVLELPDGTAARESARRDPDRRGRRPSTTSTRSTSTTSASSTSPRSSTTTSSCGSRRRRSRRSARSTARGSRGSTSSSGADGVPVVNEVNTMPGFTPISMYPRMWAVTGVDYPTLLATLIDTALARGHRTPVADGPDLLSHRQCSGVISMGYAVLTCGYLRESVQ